MFLFCSDVKWRFAPESPLLDLLDTADRIEARGEQEDYW
jgi:hypothetical protein